MFQENKKREYKQNITFFKNRKNFMSEENKNIENKQEENQNRQECNKSWWKTVG